MEQNQAQTPVSQTPPPNHLVWGILTTIFCCNPLPIGIVSIVYAAQVNSKWASGDHEGANNASKNAKLWAWIAFGVGLAGIIIYIALISLGVMAAFWADAFDF